MKALDRKVWLPSGGSLVIDRTEAMTVIDVNTGKFIGSGGNLEQTVTRNNLEAAEEIVRQLRLRDVGGIVVIDFIDMVLESNRDLVLRRLTECLGRDRTKHQVAEVTSLGLVQMTRKRVGEGLLEAFSETCETCRGRGVIVHSEPVDRGPSGPADAGDDDAAEAASGGADGGSGDAAESARRPEHAGMSEEQRTGGASPRWRRCTALPTRTTSGRGASRAADGDECGHDAAAELAIARRSALGHRVRRHRPGTRAGPRPTQRRRASRCHRAGGATESASRPRRLPRPRPRRAPSRARKRRPPRTPLPVRRGGAGGAATRPAGPPVAGGGRRTQWINRGSGRGALPRRHRTCRNLNDGPCTDVGSSACAPLVAAPDIVRHLQSGSWEPACTRSSRPAASSTRSPTAT